MVTGSAPAAGHGHGRAVRRGQVWMTDFGVPIGSQPGYQRPTVIVSNDRLNQSAWNTVLVAPVTSNLRHAGASGNVRLPDDLLPKPSVVLVAQVTAVDRRQLIEHLADLPVVERYAIDEGLRLILDL